MSERNGRCETCGLQAHGIHESQSDAPLLVSVKQTATTLGISERQAWIEIKSGRIPTLRFGRRVLVRVADIMKLTA